MANAFQSNAFQKNTFQIDADTRDGVTQEEDERLRRVVEERALSYRRSREKLRSDIILAMEGPQEAEVLSVVESSLGEEREYLFTPDYEPELRGLLSEMNALKRIAQIALSEQRRRFQEDEEDVEFLLLQ